MEKGHRDFNINCTFKFLKMLISEIWRVINQWRSTFCFFTLIFEVLFFLLASFEWICYWRGGWFSQYFFKPHIFQYYCIKMMIYIFYFGCDRLLFKLSNFQRDLSITKQFYPKIVKIKSDFNLIYELEKTFQTFQQLNMLKKTVEILLESSRFSDWLDKITEMISDIPQIVLFSIQRKLFMKVARRMRQLKTLIHYSQDQEQKKFRSFVRSVQQKQSTLSKNYVYLNKCLSYLRKQLNYVQKTYYSNQPTNELSNISIQSLAQGKLILPNLRCLSCCQFFYKGWKIPYYNSSQNSYLFVKSQKEKEKIIKYMCALLNKGGGEVLVGVDPDDGNVNGVELSTKSKMKFQEMDYIIGHNTTLKIKPCLSQNQVIINFIPIFDQMNPLENHGEFIIRIKVKPEKTKTYYLVQERTGFHTIYTHPHIEENTLIMGQKQQIYKNLITSYYKNSRKKSEHYNIQHTSPFKGRFLQITNEKQIQKEKHKFFLQFKHRHQSLIVVGSKNKISRINAFSTILEQKKILHSITHSFPHNQPENGRQIFLLSFQGKRLIPKQLAESLQKKQEVAYYQIDKKIKVNQITKSNFQLIKKQFENSSQGQAFDFYYKEIKGKRFYDTKFTTSCLNDSILLFSLLQLHGIRSIFSKEQN